MSRIRYWLSDYRVITAIGVLLAGALLYFGAARLQRMGVWLLVVLALALLAWGAMWIIRRIIAARVARRLEAMMSEQADQAVASARPVARGDAEVLRQRMGEAVKAIKTSKLGLMKGKAALYELPWYVIIGNPAAGKSTAILNSGLRFPFEDNRSNVIHGLGGTRNCDWYFTTEGIVLDTAGRYTVSVEDRLEWLTFLDLLKKNRPRAPINGVIIAASIAELAGSKPEFAIDLAKNLRQRVQELTERLEVFAPVYVVFTKADLIAGFDDFFRGLDPGERENAWGATLPFERDGGSDTLAAFDRHFDQLSEGLKEMGLSQLAMQRGRDVSPGLLTLPLEFAAIKPALRTFIATLFEENPYQFRPVFRGFYFTSALQEGVSVQHASERIARQFALQPRNAASERAPASGHSHFLLGLFRKVIFADRQLVRQYASPVRDRLRLGVFAASIAVLALMLGGWTWSYTSNRQLVANVVADLEKARQVQQDRIDLPSRIDALMILQDRLEQLDRYRHSHPIGMGLGLYQGRQIEDRLRAEYFHGMRQLMLDPVAARIESYLGEVLAHRAELRAPAAIAPAAETASADKDETGRLYQDLSPRDAGDAYGALKTYLMLADRARVESSHLDDQLTRFWRGWLEEHRGGMSREAMSRSAERLMTYYVRQSGRTDWPQIEPRFSLVEDSRQALKQVMKGQPARDRVYAQIKQRASTRYPATTVSALIGPDAGGLMAGSHAVNGAFSRAAWEGYVRDAIEEAANAELSSTDWVLQQTVQSDLTLAGSPEHVAKELTALYKDEYAREWRRFLQGVSMAGFGDFEQAVARMNALGDATHSPLRKLLDAVNRETVWDNPAAASQVGQMARNGLVEWFNRVIMRRNPTAIAVRINPHTGKEEPVPLGPIGKEFDGLARLLAVRDGQPPMLDGYFQALGKVRTRLNTIRTQGDPGPGARRLMQETLDGGESELAQAQRLVDEQMLNGLSDAQRQALRPLLMRPLIQSYAALVRPAEGEINRTWSAQVYEPFQRGLAQRYPFDERAQIEAAQSDIDQIFGPAGAIARFGNEALGSLVIRRGNTLTPQRWADLGISLRPELMNQYAGWVGGSGAAAGSAMIFEILPSAASGREYTITIDGQQLRYRNTPPQWTTFQYPGAQGAPGVRIESVSGDGRSQEVFNAAGRNGMSRLYSVAQRRTLAENHYQLTLGEAGAEVAFELRIVSMPQSDSGQGSGLRGLRLPQEVAGSAPAASPGVAAAEASAGVAQGGDR